MKNTRNIATCLTALFLLLMQLTACKKDTGEEFHPYVNPNDNDTTWTATPVKNDVSNAFLPELTNTNTFTDTFSSANETTFRLPDSSEIVLPANAYQLNNGGNVSGKITIKMTLLRKLGDFIKFDKPNTSNAILLNTKAHINIKLFSNGVPVNLTPNSSITIRFKDVNPDPTISYFVGTPVPVPNADSIFTWLPSNTGTVSIWQNQLNGRKLGYQLQTKQLRWMSCAVPVDDDLLNKRQALNVLLPLNYTNKNTVVYAVVRKYNAIIRLIPNKKFRTFYALGVPANTPLTVVAISKINEVVYWDKKDVIVNSDAIIKLTPAKLVLNEVLSNLENF